MGSVQYQLASVRTMGTCGLGLCKVPGPSGMKFKWVIEQCTNRTDRYDSSDRLRIRVLLKMPVHLKQISATTMIVKGLDPFNILRIPCASDALDTLLEVYVKEGVCSYLCPN